MLAPWSVWLGVALLPGVGSLLSFHTHPLQAQPKGLRQQGSWAVVVIVTWLAEPGASQLSVCSGPVLLSQPEGFGWLSRLIRKVEAVRLNVNFLQTTKSFLAQGCPSFYYVIITCI